mgnify:CR=1 FL=1
MSKPQIKQFRLSTAEELICEVIEWDTEESTAIVIRAAFKIIESENWKTGVKVLAFRPFMAFGEDPSIIQTINALHIVGELTPSSELLKMYVKCVSKMKKDIKTLKSAPTFDLDELNHLSDDELGDYLKDYFKNEHNMKSFKKDSDSTENIIKFTPRDKSTLH